MGTTVPSLLPAAIMFIATPERHDDNLSKCTGFFVQCSIYIDNHSEMFCTGREKIHLILINRKSLRVGDHAMKLQWHDTELRDTILHTF